MKTIGLTGGIGSGKSEVRRILSRLSYPCMDADALASRLLDDKDLAQELAKSFGPAVVGEQGRVDRAFLRAEVFGSDEKRALLESLMHPRIEQAFEDWKKPIEEAKLPTSIWTFYEAALLIEKQRTASFDKVVLITSALDTRLARLQSRGMDEKSARAVMAAQWDDERKAAKADHIIVNDGSVEDLKLSVFRMLLWLGDEFAASQT